MLKGFTAPRSPLGTAALVPSPPWHFAGDVLAVEFWNDPDVSIIFFRQVSSLIRSVRTLCCALHRLSVHRAEQRVSRPGQISVSRVQRSPRRDAEGITNSVVSILL